MRTLRAARRDWKRRQHPTSEQHDGEQTIVTITHLEWAGRGWRTEGDAILALSAAARAASTAVLREKKPTPHDFDHQEGEDHEQLAAPVAVVV